MKQKVVGIYDAGFDQWELVVREGAGGEFHTRPEKGLAPRIKVGIDQDWQSAVTTLTHEALELAFQKVHVRFLPASHYSNSSASYLFVMSHEQFAEASAWAAEFLCSSLPDMAKAYKKWHKKTKKRR